MANIERVRYSAKLFFVFLKNKRQNWAKCRSNRLKSKLNDGYFGGYAVFSVGRGSHDVVHAGGYAATAVVANVPGKGAARRCAAANKLPAHCDDFHLGVQCQTSHHHAPVIFWAHGVGINLDIALFQCGDCLLYTSPSPRDRG